jgi:plastocyanin
MPDWQIKINDGSPRFDPQTRKAMPSDNLYWTNNTDQDHQPYPVDSSGQPAPEPGWNVPPIPPNESSPALPVPTPPAGVTTLNYICKLHPSEKGAIEVITSAPTF